MLLTEFQLISLLQTTLLGLGGLVGVLWLNSFFIRRISVRYEIRARSCLARRAHDKALAAFFISVVYLALVQLSAIALWGLALVSLRIVDDPVRAMLFAGSCYTTIGIISDIASERWSMLPIFIAVSGIFSFTISTATVINMTPLFRRAWFEKHAKRIRAMVEAEGIDLSEADISDQVRSLLGYSGPEPDKRRSSGEGGPH